LSLQVKAKGARKIAFDGFLKAIDDVAAKKVRDESTPQPTVNCSAPAAFSPPSLRAC
jgi:hypothetical protein